MARAIDQPGVRGLLRRQPVGPRDAPPDEERQHDPGGLPRTLRREGSLLRNPGTKKRKLAAKVRRSLCLVCRGATQKPPQVACIWLLFVLCLRGFRCG